MFNAMNSGLLFLISTVFDIYIFILIVRLILVWSGANYFDPFTQLVIKLTDRIVKPTRRLIPNIRRLETSSLLIIIALDAIKFLLVCMLSFGFPNLVGIFIMAGGDVIKNLLQLYFFAIIFQAILSWVQPHAPFNRILMMITAPIMQPLRRFIPLVSGIDITPIPAIIILQLLTIIIANPLIALGLHIAAN